MKYQLNKLILLSGLFNIVPFGVVSSGFVLGLPRVSKSVNYTKTLTFKSIEMVDYPVSGLGLIIYKHDVETDNDSWYVPTSDPKHPYLRMWFPDTDEKRLLEPIFIEGSTRQVRKTVFNVQFIKVEESSPGKFTFKEGISKLTYDIAPGLFDRKFDFSGSEHLSDLFKNVPKKQLRVKIKKDVSYLLTSYYDDYSEPELSLHFVLETPSLPPYTDENIKYDGIRVKEETRIERDKTGRRIQVATNNIPFNFTNLTYYYEEGSRVPILDDIDKSFLDSTEKEVHGVKKYYKWINRDLFFSLNIDSLEFRGTTPWNFALSILPFSDDGQFILRYFPKTAAFLNLYKYQTSFQIDLASNHQDSEYSYFDYDIQHFNFSSSKNVLVDKHSTGAVGDITTLLLIPLFNYFGIKMIKISGEFLGATGGTINKLESVSNFTSNLNSNKIKSKLQNFGVAIIRESKNLLPVEKRIS